jgi:hypothetical protein
MSSVICQALGRLPCSAAKSAPVKTATTPGMLRAALVSISVMRACATGLRRMARCCIPGNTMLSVHRVRPVIRCSSSLRTLALPISGSAVAVIVHLQPYQL